MDIKQTLLNFHETLRSNPELSDDELLNKFPEIGKDNLSAAFDYSATLDSGKYKSDVEFEDKFPEFFPVKKKELDGQTLPEVTVKSTSKSQSQLGQPAQTPTSVSNSSLSVSQPSLATEVDYSPLSTEDLSNKYKELKTLADQYKTNIDKFKAEGDSGQIRLSGTTNEYNKIIGELNYVADMYKIKAKDASLPKFDVIPPTGEPVVKDERQKASDILRVNLAALKEKSYLEAGDPNAKNKAIFEVNKSYNAINQSPDYSTALQNIGNLKQEVFNVTAGDPESRDLLMQNLGEDAKGISTFLLKDRKAIENWQAQGLNPAQGVALDYIKVFQPEKYKAFQERATAAATGEMAGVGKQITNFELENTGIGILKTGLTERYNALQDSIVKANRGELTAEETKKVKSDSENISKWLDYVDKLEKDQYTKYPEAISLEIDRVLNDVNKPTLGQGTRAVLNLANSISGTFNDGLNAVYAGLFLNDQERINNDLEILAKSNTENTLNYTTQNQSLINRPFLTTVSDDVKNKINEIDNSSISDEEKYKQKFQILKQARKDGNIYTVVNPNKSKVNWTGEAMLNTVTSVAPQVIGAIALSGATGGYAATTKLGQLSNLFAVTAIQSYGQRFNQAKEEGSENPYFDAGVGTLIDAGTELFGNDIAQIKRVFGSGNAGKLLQKLSDGDWKRLMANKTGAFKNFGKVLLEQGKDVVTESGEEGLAQALDNLRQGRPIGEGMKETMLSTSIGFLPLKIIGLPLAFKSANMVDKFNLYSAGFNKNTTIAGIDNQLKAGDINKEEADRRKSIVNQVNGIINSMPMFDVNGKPLSDENKAKYVFNQYIKQNSKDTEGLPSSIVNNINQTAQQADADNGAILEGQSEVTVKSSKDATNKSAGQVEPAIGDISQPQGAVQGQQEIGQGEGQQGQATQPGANVSDSNISGEGQIAKPSDFSVSTIAKGFADLMDKAKKSLGINGISVDVYNQEDYDKIEKEGGKFIKSADGTAVGVLKPNGEIVSIVKSADSKQKNVAPAMIEKMKQLGGLFMDNFDIYLTKQYEKAGYKVVARLPFNEEFAPEGWDAEGSPLKNKPDVVFMAREDLAPAEVKIFDKNDYEGAKAYTEGLVKGAALPLQTISIDANNQADLGEVTVRKTIHKKVISDVNKAAQALAKVGVKFNIYQNAEEFTKATGQEKSTQGVFNDDNGTISINLSEINNSGDWNIAWHEGSHPVMNIIRNTNRPLYDKMAQGIADLAKKNASIKAVAQWAGGNYEGKETQVDESMVETIALIADNKIDLDAIPQGLRQDIIDFVNKVASYLGLDPVLSDTSAKAFIEKAKEISNALKTGADVSTVVGAENVKEYQNNLDTPEIVVAGEMKNNPQAKLSETPAIDVYESKETEKLPVRSIEDVYNKFDGKAVAINSDPTRVGELTLPSGKKIFMYGGPAYLSLRDNVNGNIGFATTQLSKVKSWSKYLKNVFGNQKGVTLVATQAPTSMMANSYALRYVLDAISTLPKSVLKSKEFKDEFFGKDLVLLKSAFGEKGYNDFVNKYKKADLSNTDVIDGMISEMAYKVGDDNNPASFKARGAFVSNLLGGVVEKSSRKGMEDQAGYISKAPKKFIAKQLFDRLGLNQEKLFYELGEKSLVDLYMNEGKWGMAVSGFETEPGLSIDSVQTGGVKHPLFNAKFPGSDAFLLDGAYEIDKLFTPQNIVSKKGNPYTKSAAQMLAGSMYVMGEETQGKKSFEYKPSPISGTKIQQKKGAVELPDTTIKQMTEDDKGNYLFYHYSPNNIKVIDPNKFGKNLATGRDERPGIGISMYYTRPDVREQGVPGDFGYVVRVNKNKVYPFNQDPLNLIEPAKRMFEKQFPGQAFDTNKQVAWVSKAAAGRGYPMTVAEWNIKGKKYLRAQTTEALKPEVYSKIKPGTTNQVEINPSLEKFKPNAKKRGQTKASGLSLEDLKDFNNLPNVDWAVNTKYLPLSEFGIENLDKENVKTLATKLAEVEGPYQPILKAIARTPNADKVKMYTLDRSNNTLGEVAGLYSRPRTMFDKPVIGITTDNYINQYAATVHEMLHWVTVDSVNKYKGTKEYKALQDIYDYLKATHPEIKGTKAAGDYYGLQNFKEFMAELLVNKNFRDKISGVMAKDKEEFKDKVYKYNQTLSNDIITTLVNYVQKVIKDLLDKWGQGIDFNKSMLDNATDLATKAFFKTQNSGQLSVGGPDINGDARKSIANMLGVLTDAEISSILQEERGLSEIEAAKLIEDVKFDPALNPTMEEIVGEVGEGERARGLAKTFPARNIDTVVNINADAKKYFQVSNKQTAEEARAYTEGKNPEDVLDYLLTQPTDIPPRVRVWMSGAAMDNIDTEINKAQLAGDTERAARLSEKQAQLINQIAPLGTELGQAIQAFRRFYENAKGSPSMLEYFTKNILTKVEKEKGSPLTEKQREDIVKLAKDLQQAKEGIPKDEATYALANYVGTITPVKPTDILEAIWYAHILSGITTQSTNFFANLWNTFAEGSVVGIRESIKAKSPAPFLYAMKGFLNGVRVGFIEGADILKTGLAAQDADKYKENNLLEYFSWSQTKFGKLLGGKVGKVLDYSGGLSPKALKYVGRALAATDAAFSRSNTEAMARMMAYNIAKEEGKTNPDMNIRKRVDEILNNTQENVAAAKEQAIKEGYAEGSRRYKRRVYEIMEQGRDKDLTNQAEEYGTRVTLNYEPEGFTRPLYKLAVGMQKSNKVTKMFIPFTRIIINLTENSLNYAGAGYWKAITGSTSSESGRRKLTADERADFAIKATLGVGTYLLLSGLTGDDEDDLFEITGNGTGDVQKNFELMKSGWRPYSIKTKSGKYISYKDWPIMPVLAAIGAQHDSAKYVDSKEPTPQSKIAMAGFVNSLWDKSVMKGLQDMLEIMSPKQEYNQSSSIGDRLISWGSDQAKSVAISNFTQQTIKMINEYGENPIKAAKGVERLYRDVPYLNDGLNPILDVFGEPVTPKTSERLLPITVKAPSKDEILSAFNENGVFIGKPQERTILLDDGTSRPMTDQEYYEFTKLSGKITKRLIQEEWADAAEILAIKDKKERRKTLAKWTSNIVSGARAEAVGELFYK